LRPARLFFAAVLLTGTALASTGEEEWEARSRLELGAGYDSNVRRELGGVTAGDGYLSGVWMASVGRYWDRSAVSLAIAEGAKLFRETRGSDMLASRLDLQGRLAGAEGPSLALELSGKDLTERHHQRDYHAIRGSLFADGSLGRAALRVGGGYALVVPRAPEVRRFTAEGPVATLGLALPVGQRHTLSAGYDLWRKEYLGRTWPDSPVGTRRDLAHTALAGYTFRGPAVASVSYAFTWNDGSVRHADHRRHRLSARGAMELPGDITLAVQLTLQRSTYLDGLLLTQDLYLTDNDENQNSFEVRLTRPLVAGLEVVLRGAVYGDEISGSEGTADYRRGMVQLAIGWRIGD
jgi:hypothetical protein